MKRGNESPLHLHGKSQLARLFASRGYTTLYELNCADLVASKFAFASMRLVCCEHERTLKNLLHNVRRDLMAGALTVIVLVPNEVLRGAARLLVKRAGLSNRVGILTYTQIEHQLSSL